MSPAASDLALSPWLAVLVVLSVIGAGAYAVRAHRRRLRRRSRGRRVRLARAVSAYLAGRVDARGLRREVSATDSGTVWTTLEVHVPPLAFTHRRRLARALEPNEHAADERRALRDDSPWRRVLAARRLALVPTDLSRRALRRALVRGPELVTLAAAQALARHRDRAALRWLLTHPETLARRTPQTLAGLLRAFGPRALPLLATALDRESAGPSLERALIEVLGRARHREAVPAIERRLQSPMLDARVAAARALGELGAIECASALLGALRDQEWQVRAQAAQALGRIQAPVAIHALENRLTDRSWWVRRHAAYALGELGHDGLAALRRIAGTSPDPYARDMAREVLDGGPHLESA